MPSLEAARLTGADAVHPGYGFLAENAEFATTVADAGLVWIGPPPSAIDAMGSKVGARALMEEAGVPIVPGCELGDGDDLAAAGERVGYPLLVKASAGGGGKGMRPVPEPGDLEAPSRAPAARPNRRSAIPPCSSSVTCSGRATSRSSSSPTRTGDRAPRRARMLGAAAPSEGPRGVPVRAVDPELRERLGAAAVPPRRPSDTSAPEPSSSCSTRAAGDEFFFLEMNTRLQVEHPVTELVDGRRSGRASSCGSPPASRCPMPLASPSRRACHRGSPLCRGCGRGFLPQTGTVERIRIPGSQPFAVPNGGTVALPRPALRLDSGVEDGTVVGFDYDPMLAKVIAWAPTRDVAAARLAVALRTAELDGLTTNRDFLVRLLGSDPFLDGDTDTGLLEREPELRPNPLID